MVNPFSPVPDTQIPPCPVRFALAANCNARTQTVFQDWNLQHNSKFTQAKHSHLGPSSVICDLCIPRSRPCAFFLQAAPPAQVPTKKNTQKCWPLWRQHPTNICPPRHLGLPAGLVRGTIEIHVDMFGSYTNCGSSFCRFCGWKVGATREYITNRHIVTDLHDTQSLFIPPVCLFISSCYLEDRVFCFLLPCLLLQIWLPKVAVETKMVSPQWPTVPFVYPQFGWIVPHDDV